VSKYIKRRHNVTVLLYHIVCPIKYRKKILTKEIEKTLKEVCFEISTRYEINFIEIGSDNDHVHFLVQGLPNVTVAKIVSIIKSVTAREIFKKHPEIKKLLWGTNLWTTGYYANTVSRYGTEDSIIKYVQEQGQEKYYKKIYSSPNQLKLFDEN